MTNKQTIDGVSRELLVNIEMTWRQASGFSNKANDTIAAGLGELRALLDANHAVCSNGILCQNSKCAECGGNGAYKPAAWERDMDYRPEELGSPETEPAAQPQGAVERLRGVVNEWETKWQHEAGQTGLLRAQLASRDALLREVTDKCNVGFAMRERLLAAISTSAKPKPRGESVVKAKPVAKLHAERLTGRDGEYGITVEDSQWFNTCRLTGGVFNLYAEQPAPVTQSTSSDQYKAELYDEVWQKARDMGFANVTDALEKLKAPVAVLLPERKTAADYRCYIESFQAEASALYNCALDDAAKLNGLKS